jgi:hypothetical protein
MAVGNSPQNQSHNRRCKKEQQPTVVGFKKATLRLEQQPFKYVVCCGLRAKVSLALARLTKRIGSADIILLFLGFFVCGLWVRLRLLGYAY